MIKKLPSVSARNKLHDQGSRYFRQITVLLVAGHICPCHAGRVLKNHGRCQGGGLAPHIGLLLIESCPAANYCIECAEKVRLRLINFGGFGEYLSYYRNEWYALQGQGVQNLAPNLCGKRCVRR
jgi:hypothetical protein